MTKTMSDGGKGSVRRNEDTSKVLEGFTRIFGESKLDKKLREEREAKECMNDIEEDYYDEDDEGEWCCEACGGPMHRTPDGMHGQCGDCGRYCDLESDY